eukprot:scaffold6131_cov72-Attheya_sp.AAC.4
MLDNLVKLAVGSISVQRLRDTLVNGFPKEATFQHIFNKKAMSQFLPLSNLILGLPELNTMVENLLSDPDVTRELAFYINGKLKQCLELLGNSKGVGEHIRHLDHNNGKYHKVNNMNAYTIANCCRPKIGRGINPSESQCTLYFAKDFKHCICQMRMKGTFHIPLAN